MSAKVLFANKVTFTGPDISGTIIQPTTVMLPFSFQILYTLLSSPNQSLQMFMNLKICQRTNVDFFCFFFVV
jgi:hypothetical protein